MRLIVGLGNPGRTYIPTKHNIGFRTIRELAKGHRIRFRTDVRRKTLLGKGRICGEEVVLMLPQTFMNLSGRAVKPVFDEKPGRFEELLVVCDDINLKLGKLRLRKRGSSGGHKGLESVIESLGTGDFPRLRMGIGTELGANCDISDYVLSPFDREDRKTVYEMICRAGDAIRVWIREGLDAAMNRFNA